MAFLAPLAGVFGGGAAAAGGAAATAGLTTSQVIALGLTAASAASSISAQHDSSVVQSAIAKNNVAYSEMAARDAERTGLAEEDVHRMQLRRLIGTQRAKYGAAGVDLGGGSPEDVLTDTIRLGEMDALTIRNNAARKAFGYRTEGWGEKVKAKAAKRQYGYDLGNTLLTSGAEAYGIYKDRRY